MADRLPPLSARNPHISTLRRLARRRSARAEAGALLVEGPTLLGEALDAGADVWEVVVEQGAAGGLWAVAERAEAAGAVVRPVADGVVARIATTETPPPLVAVVAAPAWGLDDTVGRADRGPVVVLVDVADPGNAGTIVRSAAAAGAAGVVLAGGVDPTNPKVVRAAAGALFRLPVVVSDADASTLCGELQQRGLRTVGAVARGGAAPEDVGLDGPVAVVFGNEAHGLPPEVRSGLDAEVTVPMAGDTESLNVAMATTVVLFEAARQRRAQR